MTSKTDNIKMRKTFGRILATSFLALMATGAHASSGLVVKQGPELGLDSSKHSMYVKGGFLGAGVGYAYGVNERFTLRGDFTTMGTYKRNQEIGHFDYDLKLRNNVGTLSADYFPFDSGFRLTAGVGIRDTRLTGVTSTNEFRGVALSSGDTLHGKVKWPTVAPYLGLGWGHNNGQNVKAGWGFVADAGVYFGRPDYSLTASDSAMAKMNAATGGNGQALIDAELREWKDELNKLKVFPVIHVGVSYRF